MLLKKTTQNVLMNSWTAVAKKPRLSPFLWGRGKMEQVDNMLGGGENQSDSGCI